MLKQSKT